MVSCRSWTLLISFAARSWRSCTLIFHFAVGSCRSWILIFHFVVGSGRSWILIFHFVVGSGRSWILIFHFVVGSYGSWILFFGHGTSLVATCFNERAWQRFSRGMLSHYLSPPWSNSVSASGLWLLRDIPNTYGAESKLLRDIRRRRRFAALNMMPN